MLRFTFDLMKAAAAALALLAATPTVNTLLMQAPVPSVAATADAPGQHDPQGGTVDPNSQVTMMQWAAKEGGAFVVILVILFFYRRDWKTAVDFWRDQHAITTALVVNSTQAQTETAAALRENTAVVHQAKAVMQRYLPQMRQGDQP